MRTVKVLKTVKKMFVDVYSAAKLSCVLSPTLKQLMMEDSHFLLTYCVEQFSLDHITFS